MISSRLLDRLKLEEGFRSKPYKCTAGKLTIGYGRNIEEKGITKKEAEMLLYNDIIGAIEDARYLFRNFDNLNEARQSVLIDMSFNLGRQRLSIFYRFRAAVAREQWKEASKEMLNSLWANQVGNRANELAHIIETGVW